MDFHFTEEHKALRQTIRAFMERECSRQYQRELDEKEEFPYKLWDKLSELGMFGVSIDKQYGGMGGNVIDMVIVIEELSRGMFAFGDTFMQFNCFGPTTIGFFGNEDQKQKYLPQMSRGEIKVCLGITESHGGTDALALRTTAVEEGDHFIVNGEKIFTTGAHLSDYVMLVARTKQDVEKRSRGISIFIVDMKSEGITVSRLKKVGMRALGTCQVFFEDVAVPRENLVGERDKGWYHIVNTLNNERIVIAAVALGNSQAALEDAIQFTKERLNMGTLTGRFQVIRRWLSNMFKKIELARLMTYKAAWLQSEDLPCHVEASMAKLAASEANLYATSKGLEIMGHYGCTMDSDMQRYWRDSKLFEFAPITNEMIRNFLGERLNLPRSF